MVINKYCTISAADLEAMRLSGTLNIQYPCMTAGCRTEERVPPVSHIEKQQPILQPDITTKKPDITTKKPDIATKKIDNKKVDNVPTNEFIQYMQSVAFNQLTVSECYTSINKMKERKKNNIDCVI